jgi:hypothetical protein
MPLMIPVEPQRRETSGTVVTPPPRSTAGRKRGGGGSPAGAGRTADGDHDDVAHRGRELRLDPVMLAIIVAGVRWGSTAGALPGTSVIAIGVMVPFTFGLGRPVRRAPRPPMPQHPPGVP